MTDEPLSEEVQKVNALVEAALRAARQKRLNPLGIQTEVRVEGIYGPARALRLDELADMRAELLVPYGKSAS